MRRGLENGIVGRMNDDPEFEPLRSGPRRQGDIFRWEPPEYVSPWRCYGVIVTADCDLIHRKSGGVISYIPGIPLSQYLWMTWLVKKFVPARQAALQKMTKRLNKWLASNDHQNRILTDTSVIDWLARSGPDRILHELGMTEPDDLLRFGQMFSDYVSLDGLLMKSAPDWSNVRDLTAWIAPANTDPDSFLAKSIQDHLSSMPGDVFFVPVRPDNEDEGIVLMLRHIAQCDEKDIATMPDDIRYGTATALPLARVSAPYRYAITQSLARVFSDIGLPEPHELRRKTSAARFLGIG